MNMRISFYFLLFLLLTAFTSQIQAQSGNPFATLGGKLQPTNAGKEFYLSMPANWEQVSAKERYIRLYITAAVKTEVRVYAGATLKKKLFTVPYDIVTADLNPQEAQLYTRNDRTPVPEDQLYTNAAMKIIAKQAIVVYCINRITYTSDGLLALPTSSLGSEYMIATSPDFSFNQQYLPAEVRIITPFDETNVVVTLPEGCSTVSHDAANGSFDFSASKGDVYVMYTKPTINKYDISGTIISANKPIVVIAGHMCTYLPESKYPACDYLLEMMLPIKTWGKTYQSTHYFGRRKGDYYKIFPGEDDATIWINGVKYGNIAKKGGGNGKGFIEYLPPDINRVEITSDKNIWVGQYNNSQTYDGVQTDPFYIMLTPVEQYQKEFVFCTPGADYPKNYINLVCDSVGFYDLEIAPGGSDKFEKLLDKYDNTFEVFPTLVKGRRYVGKTFLIKPGTYRVRSSQPFAAYLYGFGDYDSYGYPLSVALGDNTSLDKDAPVIQKDTNCNGDVNASVTDYPDDDKVRSNLSSIDLLPESVNYDIEVADFVPGLTRTTTYKLTVTDKLQPAIAYIAVSDMAGNYTLDTVVYNPVGVEMSPSPTIDFGETSNGQKLTSKAILRNTSKDAINIKRVYLLDGKQGFKILSPTGPFTLQGKGLGQDTIEVSLEFVNTKGGTYYDTVAVEGECASKILSQLKAYIGEPIIKVSDKDYGTRVVGTTTLDSIYIENYAEIGPDLIVYSATGPFGKNLDNVFTLPNGFPAFPLKLKPKERRFLHANFKPNEVKDYIDSVVFANNAPPNPLNDSVGVLTGKGVQPQLIATNYDWGRRRVKTGWFPAKVYLINLGTSTAKVNGIKSYSGDQTDFRYTAAALNKLNNLTINPKDTVPLDVEFNPTVKGNRKMVAEYNVVEGGSNITSTLEGIGTYPFLATKDYDFGTLIVGETIENKRIVEFWVEGDQYFDSVTVTQFDFKNGDNVLNDFRPANIPSLPIVMKIGKNDTVRLEGYFNAKAGGVRTATMKAITRDNVDTTSHWTGNGIVGGVEGVGVKGTVCPPLDTVMNAVITNTGQTGLTVDSLVLSGLSSEFTIVSPNPKQQFNIASGGKQDVQIRYKPTAKGVHNGNLLVYYNSPKSPLKLTVEGESIEITAAISATILGDDSLGLKSRIGGQLVLKVNMNQLPSPAVTLKGYALQITYEPTEVAPVTGGIKLDATDNGANAKFSINSGSKDGLLIVDVNDIDQLKIGELMAVPFNILLDDNLKRGLSVNMTLSGYGCTVINAVTPVIDITPICGLSTRLIELTNSSYTLAQNVPNPFNPVTKINYSLGLDGETEFIVRDVTGKIVFSMPKQYQKPGRYEVTINVANLSSGTYYYTLKSGVWSDTKVMTISK